MAQAILNLKKLAEEAVDAEVKRRDLVKAVRCKDCIHYHTIKTETEGRELSFCSIHRVIDEFEYNDYCSRGERKEKTDD